MNDNVIARRSWLLIYRLIILLSSTFIYAVMMYKFLSIYPFLILFVFLALPDIYYIFLTVTVPVILIKFIDGKIYLYPQKNRCHIINPTEIRYISDKIYDYRLRSIKKIIIETDSDVSITLGE